MELFFLMLIAGFLCGSIPFGFLFARWRHGVNIQRVGSGNIGFANVRRILGWKTGILTLLADIAKGTLPTLVAVYLLPSVGLAFVVGLAAIAGHIAPPWLKFRGGKGIATGLGVVAAVAPLSALAGAGAYVIGAHLLNKSSHASIVGIVVTSVVGTIIGPLAWWHFVILGLIATWTLRKNIMGTVPNYDT